MIGNMNPQGMMGLNGTGAGGQAGMPGNFQRFQNQMGTVPGGRPGPRLGLGGSLPGQSRSPSPSPRPMPWDRTLGQARNIQGNNPSPQGVPFAVQRQEQMSGGVRPGNNMMGGPSVGAPQGPSLQQIQAEMARRQVGAQLGPRNGALAGYMMG